LSLITDLLGALGGKKAVRSLADVESDLTRLDQERAAAREAVATCLRRRDELLLSGSDSDIANVDADLDAKRLVIERLDAIEPRLLEQLAARRTAAKAAKWNDIRGRYETASVAYRDALRRAVELQAAVRNIHDESRRLGFEHQSATLPTPTRWATPEGISEYEVNLERWVDAQRPRPVVAPAKPVAPPPAKPTPIAPKAKAVAPKPAPQPAKPPFEPPTEGVARITLLKPGVEIHGVGHAIASTVEVDAAVAKKIVEAGKAEYSVVMGQ
jgi:hypothetical protein